jgi:hypothetical protein
MAYTHRYAYLPADPRYAQAWPTILTDTRLIIERARRVGVVIAGRDGHRRPVLDPAEGIEFNGDATTDLDGGVFQILAPLSTSSTPAVSAWCATSRKPYDLAVAAVLLRCVQLVPEAFVIDSDGGWDTDWLLGPRVRSGGHILSARGLVGHLFEPYPPASPFTDITAFLNQPR